MSHQQKGQGAPVLCNMLVSCEITFASGTISLILMLSVSTSWVTLFVSLHQ